MGNQLSAKINNMVMISIHEGKKYSDEISNTYRFKLLISNCNHNNNFIHITSGNNLYLKKTYFY